MARHRAPQRRIGSLHHLYPQLAVAGLGAGSGSYLFGQDVRRDDSSSDGLSRVSTTAKMAAAVAAVGGLAGAAHLTMQPAELPSPAAWFDGAAASDAAARSVPVAETPSAPIADSSTIAALATPASGGSAAVRSVTAAPSMLRGAAEAASTASDSVSTVQKVAAERARAVTVTAAAPAPSGSARSAPATAGGAAVSIVTGRVSSGFGARWGTTHQGLDIAAPIGTPIHVPLAGTVINSGPARGFGLWVRVQHADGTITVYGHINRSYVSVGQKVAAGQQIAEVGNRGQATGPHLHIEVIENGTKINPKPWLDEHGFRYT